MLSVLDLVEMSELRLELAAGADAADRPLSGATVNEHPDPRPWLRGGELLMLDGLELRRSKAAIETYVSRIAEAGVAALGLGVGKAQPFPRPPRALVAACDAVELPLLVVASTPFAQISETIFSRLAQERFGAAPVLVEMQRALTRAAASPLSSASVVAALARLADLRVMLCDPGGRLVASAPSLDALPPRAARVVADMRSRTLHGAAIVPDGDGYLHIQAVGTDEVRGYLVHGARDAANDPLQAAAAAFAASLLALDLERQHVVRILQHRREQDATDRLIRGVSPAVATKLLRSFGINADRVRVAVVDVPAESGNDEVHYIAAQLPEALVGSTALGVLAVLPVDLDHAVDRLVAAAPDRPVGLGGAVRPSQCPISLRQALRGVKLARQRGGSGVVDVLALGSAKLLLGGVSVEMLQSYADATLQALDGASGGDTLLATLRAWLASGGVAESTAASLGIHRHTLRGRIDRIERLTGRRLANGHDRGEMWLAFEARDLSAAVEA